MYVLGQGLFAAVMAVRLRARSLCAQLGVQDIEQAVGKVEGETGKSQVVMRAEPFSLYRAGPSGESMTSVDLFIPIHVSLLDTCVRMMQPRWRQPCRWWL